MMVTPSGIEVDLTVNAGVSLTSVPDVLNTDYRDAMRNLRAAGFNVEIENAASDSYTKDYVIATSPVAGERLKRRLDRVYHRQRRTGDTVRLHAEPCGRHGGQRDIPY